MGRGDEQGTRTGFKPSRILAKQDLGQAGFWPSRI